MYKELLEIYKKFDDAQAVGIDGISKEKFDDILEDELLLIAKKFQNNSYDFSYYKQKLSVKSINKTREFSIPTLRDKITLNHLSNLLSDIYKDELKYMDSIYTTVSKIIDTKKNFDSFVKTDIENFYPSINHEKLIEILRKKIDDENLINLIQKAISQTTVDVKTPSKERIKYNNKIGLPQGITLSKILSEIYVYEINKKYIENKDIEFFRYVDDILIFCNKQDLKKIANSIIKDYGSFDLKIHDFKIKPEKSNFGDINEEIEFLGYKFKDDVISVRSSSLQKMYINISKLFTEYKNNKFKSQKEFIRKLNLKITGCNIEDKKYGWINYYSKINDYKILFSLDEFVKKNCIKYNIKTEDVKKFSRAIYEIKKPQSSYIYTYKKFDLSITALIKNVQKDLLLY